MLLFLIMFSFFVTNSFAQKTNDTEFLKNFNKIIKDSANCGSILNKKVQYGFRYNPVPQNPKMNVNYASWIGIILNDQKSSVYWAAQSTLDLPIVININNLTIDNGIYEHTDCSKQIDRCKEFVNVLRDAAIAKSKEFSDHPERFYFAKETEEGTSSNSKDLKTGLLCMVTALSTVSNQLSK